MFWLGAAPQYYKLILDEIIGNVKRKNSGNKIDLYSFCKTSRSYSNVCHTPRDDICLFLLLAFMQR